MKIKLLLIGVLSVLTLVSCIQDEAPNAEADIEYFIIKDKNILKNPADTLLKANTDHNRITVRVKADTDLTQLAPEFELTYGASIDPKGGSKHDFSKGPVLYTVTSQDGLWKKTYEVSFSMAEMKTEYHFEHFELNIENKKYYQWYEILSGDEEKHYDWATGNPGFKLAKALAKPDEYPTVPYSYGVRGNGIKLETKSTGSFGAMMNMRLASGNLFLGTFDAEYALKDAMKATCFGLPFTKEPVELRGYYKFSAGKDFQDEKGNIIDKKDYCDIYAVLYENEQMVNGVKKSVMLYGDNVLTHPSIVALARIKQADIIDEKDKKEDDPEWNEFHLAFEPQNNKTIDKDKLKDYGYNLSIVFASSVDGAAFKGAIGSTLYVDEVSLVCNQE